MVAAVQNNSENTQPQRGNIVELSPPLPTVPPAGSDVPDWQVEETPVGPPASLGQSPEPPLAVAETAMPEAWEPIEDADSDQGQSSPSATQTAPANVSAGNEEEAEVQEWAPSDSSTHSERGSPSARDHVPAEHHVPETTSTGLEAVEPSSAQRQRSASPEEVQGCSHGSRGGGRKARLFTEHGTCFTVSGLR